MDTPSTSIGPGLGAFIAFFVLAIALWLLMRNMNGRMRRMAYKEQQRVADLEAKDAEREAAKQAKKTPKDPPPAQSQNQGQTQAQSQADSQDADKADPAP
jgi:flagellar biosynthesis/type III secretory pathway M-ring protein FliF/YscJ